MKVRFKKLRPDASIPSYAKPGDCGMDLVSTSSEYKTDDYRHIEYGTGLAVEIPEGHVGLLFPRSSVYKTGMHLCNAVGVVDSAYRGELKVKFYLQPGIEPYAVGARVCQLVILPFPTIEPEEADELSETVRGATGFGSTGR
jgi:dUTP pyrophosphatase